jgi:hypothetical protein
VRGIREAVLTHYGATRGISNRCLFGLGRENLALGARAWAAHDLGPPPFVPALTVSDRWTNVLHRDALERRECAESGRSRDRDGTAGVDPQRPLVAIDQEGKSCEGFRMPARRGPSTGA